MGRIIKANYGIYKKWRGGGCSENKKLEITVPASSTEDEIYNAVKNEIYAQNPGWSIMGWAIMYDSGRTCSNCRYRHGKHFLCNSCGDRCINWSGDE